MTDTIDTAKLSMDAVSAWLSSAKDAEYGFFSACIHALEQFGEGNRDPLAKLLVVTSGKKAKRIRNIEGNKLPYLQPLKRIIQHIIPTANAKYEAGSDFGVKWVVTKTEDNDLIQRDKLEVLRMLKAENEGPRGKTFKELFPAITVEKPAKTDAELLAAKKDALKKWCDDNGIALAVLIHTLEAK